MHYLHVLCLSQYRHKISYSLIMLGLLLYCHSPGIHLYIESLDVQENVQEKKKRMRGLHLLPVSSLGSEPVKGERKQSPVANGKKRFLFCGPPSLRHCCVETLTCASKLKRQHFKKEIRKFCSQIACWHVCKQEHLYVQNSWQYFQNNKLVMAKESLSLLS